MLKIDGIPGPILSPTAPTVATGEESKRIENAPYLPKANPANLAPPQDLPPDPIGKISSNY